MATIVPVEQPAASEDVAQFERVWADMDVLAAEISARWPEGLSAADAVSADRG